MFGRHFKILLDHKPLQYLLGESHYVPTMASSRIPRWALIVGAYNYTIAYKPGDIHENADVLSRLPLPEAQSATLIPREIILLLDTLHEPVRAPR